MRLDERIYCSTRCGTLIARTARRGSSPAEGIADARATERCLFVGRVRRRIGSRKASSGTDLAVPLLQAPQLGATPVNLRVLRVDAGLLTAGGSRMSLLVTISAALVLSVMCAAIAGWWGHHTRGSWAKKIERERKRR